MDVLIRRAVQEDAPGIARVHVDSWRTSYAGLIAAEFLDQLSYAKRAELWAQILAKPEDPGIIFVAESSAGEIIGFVSAGPGRENDPLHTGEIYAIYLLQEAQGQGIGTQLWDAAVHFLLEQGYPSLLVWVLRDNLPARRFYAAAGGQILREKPIQIGQQKLSEVAYGWNAFDTLEEEKS